MHRAVFHKGIDDSFFIKPGDQDKLKTELQGHIDACTQTKCMKRRDRMHKRFPAFILRIKIRILPCDGVQSLIAQHYAFGNACCAPGMDDDRKLVFYMGVLHCGGIYADSQKIAVEHELPAGAASHVPERSSF